MGYFIITDSNWAKLRNEIFSLAETCHKAFEEQSRPADWLHNGDGCRLLNISKRTLQHYRDTGVLPFGQIGHKCYYKREDVEQLLQTKTEKAETEKLKSTNRHENYGTGKRFEHRGWRHAGGATRYQQCEQTD